jgi:biopolymer transport protein ExbD
MFKSSKKRRSSDAVNAGSMADIAFLLLIFFLVTTTILEDEGIRVRLPPYEPIPPTNLPDKNVLSVKINAANELLVEGEELPALALRERAKEFIMNPMKLANLPSNPRKAVISLQNDRSTSYRAYLEVYNELKAAYNELWEESARVNFGKSYSDLTIAEQKSVRKEIPLVISEADPTDHVSMN